MFRPFRDLHLESGQTRIGEDGTVVAEWTMRGSNNGPLLGQSPTGGTVALPGLDLTEVREGRIASGRGFFDRQMLLEQLGLQAIALPYRMKTRPPSDRPRGVHQAGVRRSHRGARFTSFWPPQRVIRRVRCPSCARWQRIEERQRGCGCGHPLPAQSPAW